MLFVKSVAIAFLLSFSALAVVQLAGNSGIHIESEKVPQFRSAGSSAYVRASDGAFVTDNNLFEFADVLRDNGSGYFRLLLLKSERNEHIEGHEDTLGQVGVQAWTVGERGKRTRRWRIAAIGNEGHALSDQRFFRITQWGCCDWPNVHWYFSLVSGKKLYVANSDLLEIIALDHGPQAARYIAFGYYKPGTPPLLQYGSDTHVKQQFSLLSPPDSHEKPEAFVTVGKGRETSLTFDANERVNFTILLKYADGTELHIPVQDDAIHAENAKLPKGYTLRSEAMTDWR